MLFLVPSFFKSHHMGGLLYRLYWPKSLWWRGRTLKDNARACHCDVLFVVNIISNSNCSISLGANNLCYWLHFLCYVSVSPSWHEGKIRQVMFPYLPLYSLCTLLFGSPLLFFFTKFQGISALIQLQTYFGLTFALMFVSWTLFLLLDFFIIHMDNQNWNLLSVH